MNIDEFTVYDIESYPNYFLTVFRNPDGSTTSFDDSQLNEISDYILDKRLVGFNNHHYDDLILFAICIGDVSSAEQAWELTQNLIEGPKNGEVSLGDAYKWKLQSCKWCLQSIDLKRAVFKPGDSLKKLEAAYHFENLEDLPFPPGTMLTDQQKQVVTGYCENDVNATHRLLELRINDLNLKQLLTDRYDVDVRSSGNASAAESIVRSLYIRKRGEAGDAPTVRQLKEYSRIYNDDLQKTGIHDFIPASVQDFLSFNNLQMQRAYAQILKTIIPFTTTGSIDKSVINHQLNEYRLSFSITAGGFHSVDPISIDTGGLIDYDVTSFYPLMMVSYGIQPSIYGTEFLEVFQSLITQRIDAKSTGDTLTADALKLAINSVYGKLNDKHSTFRDPRAMLMVTVTGQLLLIKLIEMMHEAGISVLSANTDGVLVQTTDSALADQVKLDWENLTRLKLDRTDYDKVVRKSVNDYIAISPDGQVKRKGPSFVLSSVPFPKPPSNDIVKDALVAYFTDGTDPANTINQSTDIQKFIATYTATRTMQAVVDGQVVQKSNRWYHSTSSTATIKRQKIDGSNLTKIDSGIQIINKLPNRTPNDLDRQWYIDEANKQINEIELKTAPPGKNALRAEKMSLHGMSIIPMIGDRNARGVRYDGSKKWANWEYDSHPNLGFLNGAPNGLFTINITNPDILPADLSLLLDETPGMTICRSDIHPDDVAIGAAAGSIVYKSDNIDLIVSVNREKKHGFNVRSHSSSTACFGKIEGSDKEYVIDGTIRESPDLEEWIISF